jgi:Zn-dependent protease
MLQFIQSFIIFAPPFLLAIILHEVAHGYVAWKLGDPTAKTLGRITLNPIKHIDFKLSILLPGILILIGSPVVFGGAKPVPVNPMYFKNPRQGMALVAVAGPITNFILAYISYQLIFDLPDHYIFQTLVAAWLVGSIIINLVLAVFNLTPLPPLDGGRILVGILPIDLARKVASLEKYGLLILFGLLYLGIPNKTIEPAINYATSLADKAILANANKHLKELREEEKLKPEENK